MEITRMNRPPQQAVPTVFVMDRSQLVCRVLGCILGSNVKMVDRRGIATAARWLDQHRQQARAIFIEDELLPQLDLQTIEHWRECRWIVMHGSRNYKFRKYLSGCPDVIGLRKPIMRHLLKRALAGICRI